MKQRAISAGRLTGLAFAALLFAAMVFNGVVYLVYAQNFGVHAAAQTAIDAEIKNRLLMSALSDVGPSSPQEAAKIWASGLTSRSAALQYAALSENLKSAYAKGLEKDYPNWVTGVSSPWVDSYEIGQAQRPSANRYEYTVSLRTKTSSGPAGIHRAKLTVAREGGYWRVSGIDADKELLPYIGFVPKAAHTSNR